MEMWVHGKWKPGHLNKDWCVPQLCSDSALDHGYIEQSDKDKRIFKDMNGQVKAVTIRDGNLYRLLMIIR